MLEGSWHLARAQTRKMPFCIPRPAVQPSGEPEKPRHQGGLGGLGWPGGRCAVHPLRARRRYGGRQGSKCPPHSFPAETPGARSGDALVAHDVCGSTTEAEQTDPDNCARELATVETMMDAAGQEP